MNDKLNNYNLMKMLCSKLSRKQIIEDLSIKCEELYLAREGILKKDSKIEQLQSNWNRLREYVIQLQKLKGINQQGFSWGVAQEVLDKINELEGVDNEKI